MREDIESIIKDYQNGLVIKQIASKYHISSDTIHKILFINNVEFRKSIPTSKIKAQQIIGDYQNLISLEEIKTKHKISITTIFKILASHNIKNRDSFSKFENSTKTSELHDVKHNQQIDQNQSSKDNSLKIFKSFYFIPKYQPLINHINELNNDVVFRNKIYSKNNTTFYISNFDFRFSRNRQICTDYLFHHDINILQTKYYLPKHRLQKILSKNLDFHKLSSNNVRRNKQIYADFLIDEDISNLQNKYNLQKKQLQRILRSFGVDTRNISRTKKPQVVTDYQNNLKFDEIAIKNNICYQNITQIVKSNDISENKFSVISNTNDKTSQVSKIDYPTFIQENSFSHQQNLQNINDFSNINLNCDDINQDIDFIQPTILQNRNFDFINPITTPNLITMLDFTNSYFEQTLLVQNFENSTNITSDYNIYNLNINDNTSSSFDDEFLSWLNNFSIAELNQILEFNQPLNEANITIDYHPEKLFSIRLNDNYSIPFKSDYLEHSSNKIFTNL